MLHVSLSRRLATLYLRSTHWIYLSDRSRLSSRRSFGVTHISLIAITYLIIDHFLDRLLDRHRLADRGSHGVLHTNLIAITYLIVDHDLDRLVDRDYIPDCRLWSQSPPWSRSSCWSRSPYWSCFLLDRLIVERNPSHANYTISGTRTLRPSYFDPISQVPSCPIWYPVLSDRPVDAIRPFEEQTLPTVNWLGYTETWSIPLPRISVVAFPQKHLEKSENVLMMMMTMV